MPLGDRTLVANGAMARAWRAAARDLGVRFDERERFMATLNDWGWFGNRTNAPDWFTGGFGRHGGSE